MSAGAGSKFPSKDGEPYPSCSRPMRVTIPTLDPEEGSDAPSPCRADTPPSALSGRHLTALKSGRPGNSNDRGA